MNDGVFIDYFLSTWVILINFINLVKERKEEILINLIASILSKLNKSRNKAYPNEHTIKCCLNLFELLEKYSKFHDMDIIKSKLQHLMR